MYALSVRADAHVLYVWKGENATKKRLGGVVPLAMELGKKFSATHINMEQVRL